MTPAILNIRRLALRNTDFRRELVTNENCQVVLMSLEPGDDIGEEIHANEDQLLVFVDGEAEVVLDGKSQRVEDGAMVSVPAGTRHNVINMDDEALKLYTIYAPPETAPGTVHHTRADAFAAETA
jgi:mannose-6-phosphate isomerase-like protein (cupin superfamily)